MATGKLGLFLRIYTRYFAASEWNDNKTSAMPEHTYHIFLDLCTTQYSACTILKMENTDKRFRH